MHIPVNLPMKLWVYNSDVSLVDAKGAAVSPGVQQDFTAVSGSDATFTFLVSGKKNP